MERKYSASSVASVASVTSTVAAVTKADGPSPLIQLERLLHRLGSVLAVDTETLDGVVRTRHCDRLKEYQAEAVRLLELCNASGRSEDEFERDSRMEWIAGQMGLLNRALARCVSIANVHAGEGNAAVKIELQTIEHVAKDQVSRSVGTDDRQGLLDELELDRPAVSSPLLSLPSVLPRPASPPPRAASGENKHSAAPRSASVKNKNSAAQLRFSDATQSEHDSLTGELIETLQLIKRNNLRLRHHIKTDDTKIDEAASLLATNSDALQRTGRNLQSFSKKSWMTTWRMLGLMLLTVAVFLAMYIFIRFT